MKSNLKRPVAAPSDIAGRVEAIDRAQVTRELQGLIATGGHAEHLDPVLL